MFRVQKYSWISTVSLFGVFKRLKFKLGTRLFAISTRLMFVSDFGMVWMGDMLLQNESNDLMMEQAVDSAFFVDSNAQALAEEDIRCRNQMVSNLTNHLIAPRYTPNPQKPYRLIVPLRRV